MECKQGALGEAHDDPAQFYENDHTIRVELDASRLTEAEVATLLRYAGVELKGKMELVR
jgi:hypothetical protein